MISIALLIAAPVLASDTPCVGNVLALPAGVRESEPNAVFVLDAVGDRAMRSRVLRVADGASVSVFYERIDAPNPPHFVVAVPETATGEAVACRLAGNRAVVLSSSGVVDRFERGRNGWRYSGRVALTASPAGTLPEHTFDLAFDGDYFAVTNSASPSGSLEEVATWVYGWDAKDPEQVLEDFQMSDIEGDLLLGATVRSSDFPPTSDLVVYRRRDGLFAIESQLDWFWGTRVAADLSQGRVFAPDDRFGSGSLPGFTLAVFDSSGAGDWSPVATLPIPMPSYLVYSVRASESFVAVGGAKENSYAPVLAAFERQGDKWQPVAEFSAASGFPTRAGLVVDHPAPLSILAEGECGFAAHSATPIPAGALQSSVPFFIEGPGVINVETVQLDGGIPLAWDAVGMDRIRVWVSQFTVDPVGSIHELTLSGHGETATLSVPVVAPRPKLGTGIHCVPIDSCEPVLRGLGAPGATFHFLYSFSRTPSVVAGQLELGIGNGGTQLTLLDSASVGLDSRAETPFPWTNLSIPGHLYVQGVVIDPSDPGSAIQVSNVLEFGPE